MTGGDWLEDAIAELRQWANDEVVVPDGYGAFSNAWLLGVGQARALFLLEQLDSQRAGR